MTVAITARVKPRRSSSTSIGPAFGSGGLMRTLCIIDNAAPGLSGAGPRRRVG